MVSTRSLVVAIAAVLAVSGCSASADPGTPAPGAGIDRPSVKDSSPGAGGTGSGEGSPATQDGGSGASVLDPSLVTLDGAAFDPATIEGRPVILWFWAPWCTICRSEAPDVAEVAAELEARGSEVVLLGVPGRGRTAEMTDFVADTGTGDITHVVDADGSVWRAYGIISQPAFALLRPDGQVDVIQGALGPDGLRAAVDQVSGG